MSKLIKIIACGVSCLVLASCANLNTEQRDSASVKRHSIELRSRALVEVLDRFEEAQQTAVQLQEESDINDYELPI